MVKKKGLPKWGELVLCTVTRITPFAAWCRLDEYEYEDGSTVEGMIHISEVAGKWVKDIRKFVKPNKQYVAKIVRIDYQKGHLNLSLKRVSSFDKKERMDTFRREKRAMGMITQIAKNARVEEANILDKLQPKVGEDFGDLFAIFEAANEDETFLDELGLPKKLKDAFNEIVERNFRIKEKTIKATLKATSLAPDGAKKIGKILSGLEKSTNADVKYISAPKYQIELRTKQPKEAEKKLKTGLEKVVKEIEKAEGEASFEFVR